MHQLLRSLTTFGLSEHEAAVYLALLELGPSSVLRVARRAKVKRTTVYSLLDALKEQGLVREELAGLKTQYVAEDPESLRRVLVARTRELDAVLPDLASLYQSRGKDALARYTGVDGLKAIYETIYSSFKHGDPYYVLGGGEGWQNIDPVYQEKMLEKKARMNVNTKLLFRQSRRARTHADKRALLRQEVRLMPDTFDLKSDILITKDRVALMHLRPPYFGIVIYNPDIVATYHALFLHLWATAPAD